MLRRLARPLLASVFIADGLDAVRHPDAHVARIEKVRPQLKNATDAVGLPDDPRLIVRASGAITVAAGLALATGKAPRLAAFVLAAVSAPTMLARYPVWAAHGSVQRREYTEGLLRSAALLGGLLIAGADTAGKPSLAWRVNQFRASKAADARAKLSDVKAQVSNS